MWDWATPLCGVRARVKKGGAPVCDYPYPALQQGDSLNILRWNTVQRMSEGTSAKGEDFIQKGVP